MSCVPGSHCTSRYGPVPTYARPEGVIQEGFFVARLVHRAHNVVGERLELAVQQLVGPGVGLLPVDDEGLVLVARRAERLDSLVAQLRAGHAIRVHVLVADLSDAEATRRVEERIQQLDALTVLVHAAGFGTVGSFAGQAVDRHVEMIQVHDVAAVRLTRAALPGMIARRRGAIIHVSSVAAFVAGPGSVTYSATKAFLNVFCEGLQAELAGTGGVVKE